MVDPVVPVAPVDPVAPVGPVGPVAPLLPYAVSKNPVDGVPVLVVTARRYEPGFNAFGKFATIVPVPEL